MTNAHRTLLRATLILLVAVGRLPAQAVSSPGVDTTRFAVVRELLALMDVGTNTLKGMEMTLPTQQASNPGLPAPFWDEMRARARRDIAKFVEALVPIYASHFSADEVRQLIQFYKSPLGRRFMSEQVAITNESLQAAQMWGVGIAADVMKELAAKGILP